MFKSTDRVILLTVPAVVLLVLMALDSEHWIYSYFIKRSSITAIGEFESSEGDVRRRIAHELTWIPVKKGDIIERQDTLYVGDKSKATLRLDTDMKLEVGADSLLNIHGTKAQKGVHLDRGSVQITSPSGDSINITTRDAPLAKSVIATEKPFALTVQKTETFKPPKATSDKKTKENPEPELGPENPEPPKPTELSLADMAIPKAEKEIEEGKSYGDIILVVLGIYALIGIGVVIELRISKKRG